MTGRPENHPAETAAICECGNCPDCRRWIGGLGSLIALLDNVRAAHMSDGDGACGGCGQPLPILRGDDGRPLFNPYIRHHHEQMALALLDRLERSEMKHAAFHKTVQRVYDLQCPPMPADNYVDPGARMAHQWWSTVLGGVLRDPRYRPAQEPTP